ncbi:hypothetical protein LCGC14_0478860 [marine sediment metagenome]|uniref:Uncharacterized protein n=1 Tax=marine sediment metagenome TaxID=412755 RepID=A0A0F9ST22_9ZZZZ
MKVTDIKMKDCGYNTNMALHDIALGRPLNLNSTRSNANPDAHRDMDGFDLNEELARLWRALHEAKLVKPEDSPELYTFIVEAAGNIDENLRRLGPLPKAWIGSARTWVGTTNPLRRIKDIAEDDEMADV